MRCVTSTYAIRFYKEVLCKISQTVSGESFMIPGSRVPWQLASGRQA